MTFLQEANLHLEKRLVEAADRKAAQLPHDKACEKRGNKAAGENGNGNGHGNGDNHMNNTGSGDGGCTPADNFWSVINRARGFRSDESNIFGEHGIDTQV